MYCYQFAWTGCLRVRPAGWPVFHMAWLRLPALCQQALAAASTLRDCRLHFAGPVSAEWAALRVIATLCDAPAHTYAAPFLLFSLQKVRPALAEEVLQTILLPAMHLLYSGWYSCNQAWLP